MKRKSKHKHKQIKEASLFRQIIAIWYEQAKRRRALRILNKQEWSVEFMEYLCEKSAKTLHSDITFIITSPAGHKLEVKSTSNHATGLMTDDDIFNKLDDEVAVQSFIRENSRR